MRTFHVIGVNLQLRQRIDTRRIAQQYIAALLHGISMLGVGCHVNQTVKPPRRQTTGNSLDMGFASAIGDIVRRMQPHGAMFIATDHKEAMKQSFGSCAVEFRTIGSLGTGELQCRNPARTARSLRQTDLGGRTTREDLQQIQLRPLAERNPQSRSAAILVQHNEARRTTDRQCNRQIRRVDREIQTLARNVGGKRALEHPSVGPAVQIFTNRIHSHAPQSFISQS